MRSKLTENMFIKLNCYNNISREENPLQIGFRVTYEKRRTSDFIYWTHILRLNQKSLK